MKHRLDDRRRDLLTQSLFLCFISDIILVWCRVFAGIMLLTSWLALSVPREKFRPNAFWVFLQFFFPLYLLYLVVSYGCSSAAAHRLGFTITAAFSFWQRDDELSSEFPASRVDPGTRDMDRLSWSICRITRRLLMCMLERRYIDAASFYLLHHQRRITL